MNVKNSIIRFFLKAFLKLRYKFVITTKDFDLKREEPFFLIANHASLNDPIFVGMRIINYPYPVASNILYTHPLMKFGLTKLVKSIPKRKGQADIQTIRAIINAFEKDKRGIMIFPEGNSTFFGEQTPTDYLPTAKIVKKIRHDLVLAKIHGGFFSSPRWGKRRRRPEFHIHYERVLTKEAIADLSLEELAQKMESYIAFNEYTWNQEKQIKYKSSRKAVGLESYLYACPKCEQTQTIETRGNHIYCSNCGKLAKINDYHFLEGLPFNNLIKWGSLQQQIIKKRPQRSYSFSGDYFLIDFQLDKRYRQGKVTLELNQDELIVSGAQFQKPFAVARIVGTTLTQKNVISFDYENQTYMFKLNHPVLFLDLINLYQGEQ
ncbi:MAG: lysophospholipid acyltransferase family protein [Acholeplasmataceae bacterium]